MMRLELGPLGGKTDALANSATSPPFNTNKFTFVKISKSYILIINNYVMVSLVFINKTVIFSIKIYSFYFFKGN